MCFDPVSLGAAAIGTAANVGGGILNRNAQAQQAEQQSNQNVAAAAARTQQLLRFLAQQRVYQGQNQEAFKPVTAAIDPATFQATQAADTASRAGAATTAINDFTSHAPTVATSGTDPNNLVQKEIAARSGVETGKSTRDATNDATLKGFGDVFSNLGLTTNEAARHIDTTNSFARTDASLLPQQQDIAAAPYSQPVPQASSPWGSILSGLGNIAATAGGSGAASRGLSALNLGDVFRSSMSPAQMFAGGMIPM
jgi:hypothetical protein